MGHYDCSDCGKFGCFGECVEEERKLMKQLAKLGISKRDQELLKKVINFLDEVRDDMPYKKTKKITALINEIKERIEVK